MNNNLSELDWLAFRYLADELTSAEREAFELRLADDFAACEALARAVELTDTILAAESLSPVAASSPDASWQLRLSWLAAGATAAAVLLAVTIGGYKWWSTSGEGARISTDLAVAWSEAFPVIPPSAHQTPTEAALPAFTSVDEASNGGESLESSAEAPPSWMLAAVRGLKEAKEAGDPDADMNVEATDPFNAEPVEN